MSQAFVTRAQAAATPTRLVQVMVRAAYEAGRPPDSSRPAFDDTTAEWRAAMYHEMQAAITAAEAAGYRITPP